MEILKETKYLQFIVKEHKPKTKVIAVVNKTHQEEIGILRWYPSLVYTVETVLFLSISQYDLE